MESWSKNEFFLVFFSFIAPPLASLVVSQCGGEVLSNNNVANNDSFIFFVGEWGNEQRVSYIPNVRVHEQEPQDQVRIAPDHNKRATRGLCS